MTRNPPTLPRASRMFVFGSYSGALVKGAPEFVRRAVVECGATDIVVGINRVQGRDWRLLHTIEDLQRFCDVCRAWGVRAHLGYWDKPHDDAGMWASLLEIAARCRPHSLEADIEGDQLNDAGVNHRARAEAWDRAGHLDRLAELGVAWSLTVIWFHLRLAAPYIERAQDHILVQILSHRDPQKPATLQDSFAPGFLTRDACHRWRDYTGLTPLVWLCAGYRQDYSGVTPAESVEVQLRAPMGYGHDAVGVFSWPWIDGAAPAERAIRATMLQVAPVRDEAAPVQPPPDLQPSPAPEQPMVFEDLRRLLRNAAGASTSYARVRGAGALAIATELRRVIERRGWRFFDRGALNLNIVGVRGPSRQSGVFDDVICVVYRDAPPDGMGGDEEGLEWVAEVYAASVDPGPRYLASPINPAGCAILKEGQYPGAYRLGWHGPQKISALVQAGGPVTVYRDDDRDRVLSIPPQDATPMEQRGRFGINFHPAGLKLEAVADGPFTGASAGCQVFASREDHDRHWMPVLRRARDLYGNAYTYTLLLAEWLDEE